jgi:hypothetical protein
MYRTVLYVYLTFLILFDFCFENFDGLVNVLLYRDLSLNSDQNDLKIALRIKFLSLQNLWLHSIAMGKANKCLKLKATDSPK